MAGYRGLAWHLDRSTGRPHLVEDPLRSVPQPGQIQRQIQAGRPRYLADDVQLSTLARRRRTGTAEEMPPEDDSRLTTEERQKITTYLKTGLAKFQPSMDVSLRNPPRRLNNREFANSVADALLLEDVGTHHPVANLVGDSLREGFDTHGDTLGMSKFHLEQYVEAARRIVDAAILTGKRPSNRRIEVPPTAIFSQHTSQNLTRPERKGGTQGFDFLDPRQRAYFADFKTVPRTGRYRITIRATGLDRTTYSAADTGAYHGDPIRLTTEMGDRSKTFNLFDGKIREIKLDEWLAAGTRFRLHYPTDGLKFRGNGNFKFQYAIGGEYIKRINPKLWQEVVNGPKPERATVNAADPKLGTTGQITGKAHAQGS